MRGRKISQAIAADGYSWDDDLQAEHQTAWAQWRRELCHLKLLTVHRCYKPPGFGEVVRMSLHHFSDANRYGYGVVSYLRQVNIRGTVSVSLIFGKSRVTPLKPMTIPRLELNACALSAEIGSMLLAELDIGDVTQVFWTDSKICLGYITNDVKRFSIFVSNRQQKVRNYTKSSQWRYINSDRNPADHASRGISIVHDPLKVEEWFNAPQFLWEADESWAQESSTLYPIPEDDSELKTTIKANVVGIKSDTDTGILTRLALRRSKWKDMLRIMAWVHRTFKVERWSSPLVTGDIETAEITLLRMIQVEAFSKEFPFYRKAEGTVPKQLRKGKGHIWRLDPFVDDKGLLRVGGRIRKSNYADTDKHPVILPKNHIVVQRILEHYHLLVHHGGRPAALNAVRSHGFWTVSGNSQVKKLIHNCVLCRKYHGKLGEQKMADLLENRTLEAPPFTHSGVDMVGPFYIKDGRKQLKRFVALFTCFASRAVHLEVVSNLTADNFILALRRFLARHGTVSTLRLDNGTNQFCKAYREMDHEKIGDFLLGEKCDWIRWEMNVPEASHAGGVWERQIRSVRNVLSSILHDHSSTLTGEAFYTLLTEAELIVNSRPLTSDANDPTAAALSPIQLLTLKSKVVLPPPGEFQKEDVYCRKRWRHVQHLANLFWTKYRREYLQSLQQRNKWCHPKRNFTVGDIVLLKDSNVSRQQWPMGQVVRVFPSEDGLVRSVELKVPAATKLLKRPIQKIVLLVEADADQ